MGKSKIYDSYIRAIRWASDRIGDSGVIGYVSGSGFAEKPAMDGLRKSVVGEFNSIYVLNLRGDIRKNMLSKGAAREGQNVFDTRSMTGIAITLLVKKPGTANRGQIFYHDIGDDLSTKQKLDILKSFASIDGIAQANAWQSISPDKYGDWLKQRVDGFDKFLLLGSKGAKQQASLFESYSMGVKTNRDEWTYNANKEKLAKNVQEMIAAYNKEVARYCDSSQKVEDVPEFVTRDKTKIKWTSDVLGDLVKGRQSAFVPSDIVKSLYRPFIKQWVYANKTWNWTRHLMPQYFPDAEAQNRVIIVSGVGSRSGFSALMSDTLPCLDIIEKGQCFPLYLYGKPEVDPSASGQQAIDMFGENAPHLANRARRSALTDVGLAHFHSAYPSDQISKEDVFYYVYGLMHSPNYRERYADNLSKELPRIPCVKTAADFWAFSQAGRKLADLHLNYETVAPYPVTTGGKTLAAADYRVEKMKYGKKGKDKDLTTLHYNTNITLTGIPLEAYEYVVNGKPALDWVVERQCVKTEKDSGIVNDANDWAVKTQGDPRYPVDLFQRVITVSLETMKIVNLLPKFAI